MKFFGKNFKMSASLIVMIVLLLATVIIGIMYWTTANGRLTAILGSLFAGLIVAIIQFLIAWQDYRETEKITKLKLMGILYNRASKELYVQYIDDTNRNMDIMGVTAVRLFRDFADTTHGSPDSSRVLLKALDNNVHVRLLLPAKEFLNDDKLHNAEEVRNKYYELRKKYQNIEIRYFSHIAAHSIFRMDDTCIIGPVFPDLESRNTPALRLRSSSPMAIPYLDYFELEWEKAKEIDNA